jgi:transposase
MQETEFYQMLLSLPDLVVDKVELTERRITLHCHTNTLPQSCPHCLKPTTQVNQYTQREVRDLDISGRQVWLVVRIRQFFCPDCDRYFTEQLRFADSGKSHTHRQAKWIFDCCAKQPFTEVGALLGVNAKTVERIYYQQVNARLDLPNHYASVRKLGIDEFAHRKGKASYCCVLTDLDRNIVLDVLPNRSKETLIAHFEKLGPGFCAQIESVSFDMWSAYHTISQRFFPQAVHVVDRFHVVRALNKALDALRRKLRREQPGVEAFKHIKWDLFKAQLTTTEQTRLQKAFAHSSELRDLVALRNDFHLRFESATNPQELEQALRKWTAKAKAFRQRDLIDFIHMLQNWLRPIANFASQRLTNAATEGLNNVIRYIKRIGKGLPKFEHLRLRVLAQAI